MENDNQISPGQNELTERLQDRKRLVRLMYDKVIDRLWVGNGVGAVTVVTSLQPESHLIYTYSFLCFVIGLISLGFSSLSNLSSLRKEMKDIDRALDTGHKIPILEMNMKFIKKPWHFASFHATDFSALFALIFGIVIGFLPAIKPATKEIITLLAQFHSSNN